MYDLYIVLSSLYLQVEFYFSDVNILKDAFLLKHVKRNKQGFVSLKLVTSFRKLKSLTKDYRVVAHCLVDSEFVEVNEEGTKVRRKQPLPDYDETTPSRTVVAVNLPFDNPTIENVAEVFSKCGDISLIRVLKSGKSIPPDIKKHLNKHPELGNVTCAVIEFETHESAVLACKEMTNTEDWRKGLSVSLLAQSKKNNTKNDTKPGKKASSSNKNAEEINHFSSPKSPKEAAVQGFEKGDIDKKKSSRGLKKKDEITVLQGEGDSSCLSSDNEEQKRKHSPPGASHGVRSSLSPKVEMSRLSPSGTPRTTPKNTPLSSPKSSPRNSPNIRRKAPHGKSPLVGDALSPGTSPKPSPCVSPESRRKGSGINSLEASPSPGCSPWLQRKIKAQQEGTISPLVGSPIGSPRIGRRLLDLEGVVRQPKGPDGPGFYSGMGRGKPGLATS